MLFVPVTVPSMFLEDQCLTGPNFHDIAPGVSGTSCLLLSLCCPSWPAAPAPANTCLALLAASTCGFQLWSRTHRNLAPCDGDMSYKQVQLCSLPLKTALL